VTAATSAATLEFRRATKRYPGQSTAAVEDLSLTVPAGEICVLVGPSGCGKTTAMRMVNRMTEITSGDIMLDDSSVRERRPAELRREIGYAIQQIGLFPHLTVGGNIATVPRLLGWSKERIRGRVASCSSSSRSILRRLATAIRRSSRAASVSGWASLAPWRWILRSCSWMSPSAPSTRSTASGSRTSS